MEAAIEAGADDVESDEDGHWIYTSFEAMNEAAAALEKALGEPESVKIVWKPQNTVMVDADKGATLQKLIGVLEEDDDVQNVYANFEMSEEDLQDARELSGDRASVRWSRSRRGSGRASWRRRAARRRP